ncbi:BTB/POZ domain-containing protein At5g66560 [Mercurialis annua]|uniref:BTB/POZ domain-containing protein At5g66560 n=1 Tax=Mercurialis annua TaxID=3986 RepID=UPI00215F4615|nr:BTB/POZ domain-containing protein At5g66560 [Mercurialis annua]XP_050205700.1 BTB/POZ domain-containing protein At5g66560 [Mercurialis annua]
MAAEKQSSKGQAWFCTTGLPSDIVIEVEDMTFHLHKFPLMSKSRKLHELIAEQEANTEIKAKQNEEQEIEESEPDEIEEVHCHITLPDFPGGSETFEMAAKFCYSVKIELTSSTVAPLRCAGEFLEMTEEYSEDNLISKTERFLSQSVLKSLKESIKALKSCEKVMSLAETLTITQRCIDSIASRASTTDPAALFGWPVSDGTTENKPSATSNQALWNGIESAVRRKKSSAIASVAAGRGGTNADSWLEYLSLLSLPLFKRLIFAMKERDLSPEIIESCLMYYAKKYIPGVSRLNRKPPLPSSSSSTVTENEQREVLETITSNLPLEKNSTAGSSTTTTTATRFLFGLLRTANILNASESCRLALERKIGLQLEHATLDDLLIPSYSYLNETLYDVDCMERILGYFLDGIEERNTEVEEEGVDRNVRTPSLMLVGKLIDGYLAEIASDANLKPDRFCNLAVSLPEQARLFDDGLYRAVDVYLKAHPWISENEREKICGVMDCQKLTLEACTHAAQNERLPLRAVVQVLFFEQLQLRHAIAGTLIAAEVAPLQDPARPSVLRREQEEVDVEEGGGAEVAGSNTWRSAVRENQVLRLDMDSMRTRVHQLERECSTMKKVIEKIDTESESTRGSGWRGSITRKFGCKFKSQVCDSHESTAVNVRKGKQHHHHQQ